MSVLTRPDCAACHPGLCPVCGQANACAMAAPGGVSEPCWCTRVQFSAELFQQVPEAARNKACICAACVAASEGPAA